MTHKCKSSKSKGTTNDCRQFVYFTAIWFIELCTTYLTHSTILIFFTTLRLLNNYNYTEKR